MALGKLGFLGVFVVVGLLHWLVLRTAIAQQPVISKPDAKVYRITLSSVVVKKSKPKVEPIILPADPEPVVEVEPLIEKPKPVPKKIKKMKPKRKKRKVKKVHKPKPIIKEKVIVPEVTEPIVEEIAPQQEIDTSAIKDAYTSHIRRQIQQHLYYPRIAKRMRIEGVVRVAFRVLKSGQITQIRVINSSKKLLSKGAIKTLKALSLKAIPDEIREEFLDINIPIEFRLIKG